LSSVNLNEFLPENETPFQYGDRIEYSMLQTQDRLAQLDLKNQKAGYLPKVFLTSTYGYSTGRPQFGDLITNLGLTPLQLASLSKCQSLMVSQKIQNYSSC
jgi:outer membrane protein TolC